MAILRKTNETQSEGILNLEINNGDLKALGEIVERWGFRDEESALRFALAILSITKRGALMQEKPDGSTAALQPNESLLKD